MTDIDKLTGLPRPSGWMEGGEFYWSKEEAEAAAERENEWRRKDGRYGPDEMSEASPMFNEYDLRAAIAYEREQCAKVCEAQVESSTASGKKITANFVRDAYFNAATGANFCAAAIRARGNP